MGRWWLPLLLGCSSYETKPGVGGDGPPADADTDTDTDTAHTGDTGGISTDQHPGCLPVTVHSSVLGTEWLPQAPIIGLFVTIAEDDAGRIHVVRNDNLGGFHGSHFSWDGSSWSAPTPLVEALAQGGLVHTDGGLVLAGYDGAGNTGVSTWDAATGWSSRSAVPGAGLLAAPYAVIAVDGAAAMVSGDGSIQRHVLSAPPSQALVASSHAASVQQLRPGQTEADVWMWGTDADGWVLQRWSSDRAADALDSAWSPGSFGRSASAIVPLPIAEPAVMVQWDHALHVVFDGGAGWTELLIDTGPSEDCSAPPYYAGDVCQHDEGYVSPIATWVDGSDAALVYGRTTRTGQRTAVYMPGPAGGYYAWSDPPPWTGTVEHVVFDPGAGTVGAPTVLLDGVVATAGQALVDGGGQVQLVMKDHDCRAYDPWAARVATIDPAAL